MEDIERHAHERRENLEREAMLRFSKSKAKDKDAMEKAKQVYLLCLKLFVSSLEE